MLPISIEYPFPLVEATLIRRFKRFFAEVRLTDGIECIVHCPNPGRIPSVSFPGSAIRLLPTPHTKMQYRWVQTLTPYGWAGVDTLLPNKMMKVVFLSEEIAGWGRADEVESEVTFEDSRFAG